MASNKVSDQAKDMDRVRGTVGRMTVKEYAAIKKEPYLEKYGNRKSRYNETVRANNKRTISGKKDKPLPRGKAGDKTWKPTKRLVRKTTER